MLGEAAGAELGRCNEADGSNRLNASIAIFLDRGPLPDDCLWLAWSDKPMIVYDLHEVTSPHPWHFQGCQTNNSP